MIKNYLDLIEWIRSPKNTNKDYSLTLFQSCILQRLIKYSRVNQNITYSNEVISEHMFRSKKHVENNLPLLSKKGLITTTINRSRDEYGNFISKRTIRINWEKLQEIKTEMDEYLSELVQDVSIERELPNQHGDQFEKENKIPEKDKGYKYVEKKGESFLVKNNHSIYMRYLGVGDQLSLYFLNPNGKKEMYTPTLKNRFKKYLDSNGIEFKDFTEQHLLNMN